MANAGDVRAPRTSIYAGRSAGPVSFEVYFLRDLFDRGKLTQQILEDVIRENNIPVNITDVLAVLQDKSGNSISAGLARHLADLASGVGHNN